MTSFMTPIRVTRLTVSSEDAWEPLLVEQAVHGALMFTVVHIRQQTVFDVLGQAERREGS